MPLGARTRTDPQGERPASEPQRWTPTGELFKRALMGSLEFFIVAKHVPRKMHRFKHVQFRSSKHIHAAVGLSPAPSGTSPVPIRH